MREQGKAKLHLSEHTTLVLDPKQHLPVLLRLQHEQALKMQCEGRKQAPRLFLAGYRK